MSNDIFLVLGCSVLMCFTFGILVISISLIIAASRKGSSTLETKPKQLQSITTTINPRETLKIIVRFAQQSKYQISNIDEAKCQIVLEESPSFAGSHWGFFYPIFVSLRADNTTLIEIGIKSKFRQADFIILRHHERCVNGLKAALFAQQ